MYQTTRGFCRNYGLKGLTWDHICQVSDISLSSHEMEGNETYKLILMNKIYGNHGGVNECIGAIHRIIIWYIFLSSIIYSLFFWKGSAY
jgi:hypothetical protein